MTIDALDIYPVYVDESYGPHHPYLCIGGYVFEQSRAKEMSARWAAILASKALPYFHMGACNGGYDEFAHLDRHERDWIARQMIALTRQYSEYGFGIAVAAKDYDELFPGELKAEAGSPYSFALRHCLTMTRRWAERTRFSGKFAFFFERGHQHAREAERVIGSYGEGGLAERFRFFSSAFIAKQDAEPLQAADILAWHTYTAYRRQAAGQEARKDLVALLRDQDMVLELSRERLIQMARELRLRYSLAASR